MQWKQKFLTKQIGQFLTMIKKRSRPKTFRVDKGIEFAENLKKLCKTEGVQIYSTMSDTKAAFVERTIRSLKNILYRDMEDYGYKYIHNLPQFITILNSRTFRSKDSIPKKVEKSDFLSILYSKPLRDYREPKFSIGDRDGIFKWELLFRKGYKPQYKGKFRICCNFFQKTSDIDKKGWTGRDFPW